MKKYLLLMLMLTGCATTGKYEARLQSWVGLNASILYSQWGVPTRTSTLPDGTKAYEYLNSNGAVTHSNTEYDSSTRSLATTSRTTQSYCKTTFFANSTNQITSWRWEGNTCTSR